MVRALFVDTETNGLPKDWKRPPDASDNWPRIVEMAWTIQAEPQEHALIKQFLIQPNGWEIGESEKIHGISPLEASALGHPIAAVLEQFVSDLQLVDTVVAHNVAFDRNVIAAEIMRARLKIRRTGLQFYCTMEHGTDVVKIPNAYGYKWPSLEELHRHLFRVNFVEAHRAAADVAACARAYWRLQELESQKL